MVFLALTWVSRSPIWTIYLLASHLEVLLGLHGLTPSKGVQVIWWMACPSNGQFFGLVALWDHHGRLQVH
jgi:hypothetical protein